MSLPAWQVMRHGLCCFDFVAAVMFEVQERREEEETIGRIDKRRGYEGVRKEIRILRKRGAFFCMFPSQRSPGDKN